MKENLTRQREGERHRYEHRPKITGSNVDDCTAMLNNEAENFIYVVRRKSSTYGGWEKRNIPHSEDFLILDDGQGV